MPSEPAPRFEAALEADMGRLAVEIERHRSMPETRALTGEELLKRSIQAASHVPVPPSSAPAPQQSALPAYMDDASPEAKLEVEYLVDLALRQGIDAANAAAVKSKNPFILDAFHDSLTGKLYPEFRRRGIL